MFSSHELSPERMSYLLQVESFFRAVRFLQPLTVVYWEREGQLCLFWEPTDYGNGSSRAEPSVLNKIQNLRDDHHQSPYSNVPFGVTYEKIGTIQRRLAWPLHKDDTLSRSGRSTDLNIFFVPLNLVLLL